MAPDLFWLNKIAEQHVLWKRRRIRTTERIVLLQKVSQFIVGIGEILIKIIHILKVQG